METKELIQALRADAEWAHANEWETPITLGDHLDAAADAIEALTAQLTESQRREKAAVVTRIGKNPDGTMRCSCPSCGRLFQEEAFVESYCPDCGQALSLSGPQEAGEEQHG